MNPGPKCKALSPPGSFPEGVNGRKARTPLSRKQESILDLSVLSSNLLAEQEVAPRAQVLADFVAEV